jgi:hypothetical protein
LGIWYPPWERVCLPKKGQRKTWEDRGLRELGWPHRTGEGGVGHTGRGYKGTEGGGLGWG